MGKYSEVYSNERILDIVKGRYANVLIIGCGGCMNESLALKNGDWIFDKEKNIGPAILKECIRLSNYLSNEGINNSYYIINSGQNMGCIRNEAGMKKGFCMTKDIDAILMMSCLDGIYGIKEQLKGYRIPIYRISSWKGMFYYSYKENSQYCSIVEGHVKLFDNPNS